VLNPKKKNPPPPPPKPRRSDRQITECLLSDIAENAVSYSYRHRRIDSRRERLVLIDHTVAVTVEQIYRGDIDVRVADHVGNQRHAVGVARFTRVGWHVTHSTVVAGLFCGVLVQRRARKMVEKIVDEAGPGMDGH
jgi:hypothetical protein